MMPAANGGDLAAFLKLFYLAPLLWSLKLVSLPHRRREKRAAQREARACQNDQCQPQTRARLVAHRVQVPDPLPPRKRRLSISHDPPSTRPDSRSSNEDVVPQRTHSQDQSPFFEKLPPELRRMIYHEVLGGKTMHVVQKGRRFVHIPCRAHKNAGRCLQHECWTYSGWDEGAWSEERESDHPAACASLLVLARTCRRVYSESIPLLYSANNFSFNTLPNLLHFPLAILPTRLTGIRSLEFKWHFVWPFHQKVQVPAYLHSTIAPPGHDEATWSDVWRMIGGMRGLRELRVTIMFNGCIVERDWENRVLAPLMGVGKGVGRKGEGRLDIFKIDVPWASLGNDWSEAPFDITYRDSGEGSGSRESLSILI